MERRAIDITVLSNIKSAWASPSACVKSNWCRIPSAIIIALGLLILFTFFCCCAQCLSCCCCRPRRARGFGDQEAGRRALLPQSTAYGGNDLPVMPSYKLDSLKTPKYAIIGDDGSVMTDDPEKRMRDDFPATSARQEVNEAHNADYTGPDFSTPATSAPQDIFATANGSFHDTLLNQQNDLDTSYTAPSAGTNYPPSYRSNASPPRRNPMGMQPHAQVGSDPMNTPTFPGQQMAGPRGPRAPIAQREPRSNRGEFNEGGPFPIIGRRAVNNAVHEPSTSFDRTDPSSIINTRLPSPPRAQSRFPGRTQYQGNMDMDDLGRPESPAPYPTHSPTRHNLLADNHEFDPYSARRGHF